MKNLVLETTAPFQGLAELVAYHEGLFEKEGLVIEWVDRDKGAKKETRTDITSPDSLNPHSSHGRLFEEGPEIVTPGTKMPIQKIKKETDRLDLINFLKEATR